VHLSQVSQLILNWKIFHPNEDLVMNLVVVGVYLYYNVQSNLIYDIEH
jgi:hypothetical protein